jgi:hypothetical protein
MSTDDKIKTALAHMSLYEKKIVCLFDGV